jgi:uncharacterized protein with PIN domain
MVHAHDDEVLSAGIRDDRIILTSDRELFKRVVKWNARGVLIDGDTELDNLVHILSKSGINHIDLDSANSRCPECGATLSPRTPSEVTNEVPEAIPSRYSRFFQCTECNKVYWEGGHFARMNLIVKQINAKLAAVDRMPRIS